MIKEFKNNPVRKSGIVYGKMFETAKKWYQRDPIIGGEYAISFLEAILTGDISSDDVNIEDALEGYVDRIAQSKNKYDAKVAASEEKYRRIIEMKNRGMTQAAIARELGVQPPAVSKMFTKIRADFPHLLEKEETLGKFPEISGKIGNFQESLETSGNMEIVDNVSESFQESLESCDGIEETGNVSKFPKFPYQNYDYNYDYNYDLSGKTSSIPPVDCVHDQDEDEIKKKIAGFNF